MKKFLIMSGLSLIAVSSAIAHSPSEMRTFLTWLYHITLSTKVISDPHLIVEHKGKYCPVVYRADRRNTGNDIKLSEKYCIEKSDYVKGVVYRKGEGDAKDDITIFHPTICPSANVCGTQTIGSYIYEWCWQDPAPPTEPKMSVDIYFGSPSGAHIDKQNADSSGRPGSC